MRPGFTSLPIRQRSARGLLFTALQVVLDQRASARVGDGAGDFLGGVELHDRLGRNVDGSARGWITGLTGVALVEFDRQKCAVRCIRYRKRES